MKVLIYAIIFIPTLFLSQVVISDKVATPVVDNSAVLKLDSNDKGLLYPRVALASNTDIVTVPSPQNGYIVFNTNTSATLPQSLVNFESGKWLATLNKEQVAAKLDVITIASAVSPGNIIITGYSPGVITLGTGTTGWTSLGINESRTFTRVNNSFAFTVEGMTQIDKTTNEFYEYAIGIFVDDKLVVTRKYHKNAENFTCSWHKFKLNGLVNNLSLGSHTIKVMAKTFLQPQTHPRKSIYYGGVAHYSSSGNPLCDNMSNFMSKIILNTTIVEYLN